MYHRKKEQYIPCVKQLLSREQVISPLIAVFYKSTECNTKDRSETSATVTYFLISNANQLEDQYFLESNHSRLSYNSSVVVRQQYTQTSSCTTTLLIPIL